MFNNYNYRVPPNPGYPGFQFPPPISMNYPPNFVKSSDQNFINIPEFPINSYNADVNTIVTLEARKKDEEFIKNFIDEEGNTSSQPKDTKKSTFKVSDIKTALTLAFKLNQTLKDISAELRHKDLSDSEWHEKIKTAEILKNRINNLVTQFKEETSMKNVKRNLENRKKKRLREKRKREAWKEQKIQNKEKRARLNAEVDNWIKKKQDVIEKEKQEDRFRKDADIVLADVRGKRSDAKKFLALLREMETLRKTKVKIARARGENLPSAADEAFNNIIGKLKIIIQKLFNFPFLYNF